MITSEEKEGWKYLVVKNISETNQKAGFYFLNYLDSFKTETKLKSNEKISKNKFFCEIVAPSEKNKILKFNQYIKSDKMLYIIYADLEFLIKKIDGRENKPENSSATKVGELTPGGYAVSTIWGFHRIIKKHTFYRGKDCMKHFCASLREHAKNINSFEKKTKILFMSK